MRLALTCLFALYGAIRCCFNMHYFEGFAPLTLVCELSMVVVATVCALSWLAALGQPGQRLRGLLMVAAVSGSSWLLWFTPTPEVLSAHVRFALHRDHYKETATAWERGEVDPVAGVVVDGVVVEGDRLYFPWNQTARTHYGVVYDARGALPRDEGRVIPLHHGWYYRLRVRAE